MFTGHGALTVAPEYNSSSTNLILFIYISMVVLTKHSIFHFLSQIVVCSLTASMFYLKGQVVGEIICAYLNVYI